MTGRCLIVHKSGRTERTIDAHKGSVLATRWNHDGTSLLTCGEDGSLKVWSRSGMLRSTHVQSESPIYAAAWSPFSTSILYTNGKNVAIQPFSAGSKVTRL
jgi:intraflagellar transport protein 80